MIDIGGRHFQTQYNVLTDEDIKAFHQDTKRFMEELKKGTFNKLLYDKIQRSQSIPQNQKTFVDKILQYLLS